MTAFLGRIKEMQYLEKVYADSQAAFIPIYGRRRVGKSELILHFITNKPALYFTGSRVSKTVQLREFMFSASVVFNRPYLASMEVSDWKTAFTAVFAECKGPAKLVLALDEFQWMVETSPELPSVVQQLWDKQWRDEGNMFLILCGSYIGFMEREVLGSKSPLFGRRTGQIHLKPFSFNEAGLFHSGYSLEDRARAYFITGGIPLYLKLFKQSRSIESNIQVCFLDEFSPLYREVDFLLREEIKEVSTYYGILMSIASQKVTVKELSATLKLDSRSLPYFLQQLVELGYIQKKYPLNGNAPSARHVRYAIADPLLRFWFRFIYPHTSTLLQLGSSSAFATLIKPELTSYFGSCFEVLCREMMPLLYKKENVTADFDIGEYWDKTCQVDVVGYRSDNWTDICECKWGRLPSGEALCHELEAKVQRYPNPRNATIGMRIFSRVKPAGDYGRVIVHTLEDLYKAGS